MTDLNYKGGLFSNQAYRPLADRLRPKLLSDVVGQDHLLGSDGLIGQMAENNRLISIILWTKCAYINVSWTIIFIN